MKQQDIRSAFLQGKQKACSSQGTQPPNVEATAYAGVGASSPRSQAGSSSKEPRAKRRSSNIEQDGAARKKPTLAKAGDCTNKAGTTDLGNGAFVDYYPGAFSAEESSDLYTRLKDGEVGWQLKEITMMGRQVMQPRKVAYMADSPSMAYTYSKTTMHPDEWAPSVKQIKARLTELLGERFNSCLLNCYRDGNDHLSWHADNEKPYGRTPTIVSVSFGARRDFIIRRNAKPLEKLTWKLGEGDVLVMRGTTQQHFTHSVPARRSLKEGRINLTFRNIIYPERH